MVRPATFDPFSIPKYHRVFWQENEPMGKKILAGCVTLVAAGVEASRFLLDVKTNLIFPNRFSAHLDTAAVAAVTYIAFTVIVGFGRYRLNETERQELLRRLSSAPAR